MKRNNLLFYIFTFLLFTGCNLAPKYKRENTPQLTSWKEPISVALDQNEDRFWELFQDPTLNLLVTKALSNNLDLKVAIENVNMFLSRWGVVKSQLFPQLEAKGGGARDKVPDVVPLVAPGTPQIGNSFDLVFNASYLIDFWGEIRNASKGAYHRYLASVENRKSVVLSLVSSLVETYFSLRQYDRQLEIAIETVGTREESYRLALIRFNLGLTSKVQVEQALSELEFAKLEVNKLNIKIAETEDLMAVLLGEPTQTIPRGLAINCFNLPQAIPDEMPSNILDQRPDLMRKEQELIAANADIGVAKAKFFPQFNLTALYGYESSLLPEIFNKTSSIWGYGLSLVQEIFTGGKLTSNLKLTEAEQRKTLYTYHQAILNAFKEVNDALSSLKYYKEMVATQKTRVEALEKYERLVYLQYNEGLVDYLTYLDAQRQVFDAKLSEVETLAKSFISYVNIYKAMGGNWVQQADHVATEKSINPLKG
jgi:multidrug efflux system outer membrane protein